MPQLALRHVDSARTRRWLRLARLPDDVLLGPERNRVCAAATAGHEPAGLLAQAARLAGRRRPPGTRRRRPRREGW